MKNRTCVIVPARYDSSRFPGKPLAKILGKEMILWVIESAAKAVGKENVFVATNSTKIAKTVTKSSFKSIITSNEALTGTDRIAEAIIDLDYEIIINVQGDEPLVKAVDIENCIKLKKKFPEMIINGFTWLKDDEQPDNFNIPKVITNQKNEMIYMSRKALPGFKDSKNKPLKYKKQVCIYGYNKDELNQFKKFGKSTLEYHEDIEILRFLELNKKILMFECDNNSIAVDQPEDIIKVENFVNSSR